VTTHKETGANGSDRYAAKRFSLLFGIIYGGVVFHEKKIVSRFIGGLIMLSGAVLITLKG
jgi:hypothetical protein